MFPEYQAQMDSLRANDRRFDHLCQKHAQLDQQIQMMQSQPLTYDPLHVEQLKKQKLALKQSVYSRLQHS